MKRCVRIAVGLLACLSPAVCAATEPNETFAATTVLEPGALTVSDALTAGVVNGAPDTLLGIRNGLGAIVQTDDDGSFFGNGAASGLQGVPTNSGSIQFAVTGFGDDAFAGDHLQHGSYRVHIDVREFGGAPVSAFSELAAATPGELDEFAYSNPAWIGGSYSVNIDNLIPIGGDVDFFRFTGLAPNAAYTAMTLDGASSGIDTILAWLSLAGSVVGVDDDSGGGTLSRLAVAATAGGTVTLAVSGFGDRQFLGTHTQAGSYQLRLTRDGSFADADFNESGVVDGDDLGRWSGNYQTGSSHMQGDADGDHDADGADFLVWQRQLGSGLPTAASADVLPEPTTAMLGSGALCALAACKRRGARRRCAP